MGCQPLLICLGAYQIIQMEYHHKGHHYCGSNSEPSEVFTSSQLFSNSQIQAIVGLREGSSVIPRIVLLWVQMTSFQQALSPPGVWGAQQKLCMAPHTLEIVCGGDYGNPLLVLCLQLGSGM